MKPRSQLSQESWLTIAIAATVCWLIIAVDYYLPCLCGGGYRHPFLRNVLIGVYPVIGYVSASVARKRAAPGSIGKRVSASLVAINILVNSLNGTWLIIETFSVRLADHAGPWLLTLAAMVLVLIGWLCLHRGPGKPDWHSKQVVGTHRP